MGLSGFASVFSCLRCRVLSVVVFDAIMLRSLSSPGIVTRMRHARRYRDTVEIVR
jgi:hypothetical protein